MSNTPETLPCPDCGAHSGHRALSDGFACPRADDTPVSMIAFNQAREMISKLQREVASLKEQITVWQKSNADFEFQSRAFRHKMALAQHEISALQRAHADTRRELTEMKAKAQ